MRKIYSNTITIFLIGALIISCATTNVQEEGLITDVEINSSEISSIQDIDGEIRIKNKTNEKLEYQFGSSCQVAFEIITNSDTVYRSEDNLTCEDIITHLRIEIDETQKLTLPKNYDNDLILESGEYILKAYLCGYENEVFAEETFTVN